MKRLSEAWFEWGGVRCEEKGLRLLAMPRRPIPALQGERLEVPGRDGFLWMGRKDARQGMTISVECSTLEGFSADALTQWLQSEGLLRFSDEPNVAYQARVTDEFLRENVFLSFDRLKMSVPFVCQPHRYLYPAAEAVELTEAGMIVNPGTVSSAPRITIEGTGDMTVEIGGVQIGVTGSGVIVDSEMMDCFELDGVTLANSRVTLDDFPMIPSGECAVSWSGDVERVMIEGRWRCL